VAGFPEEIRIIQKMPIFVREKETFSRLMKVFSSVPGLPAWPFQTVMDG
jgi:hypothetical protein